MTQTLRAVLAVVDAVHRLARFLIIPIIAMWVTVLTALLALDNTDVVATISKSTAGMGDGQHWINAADDVQVLSGLLVALPALLLLLIAAGALHPLGRTSDPCNSTKIVRDARREYSSGGEDR